MISLRLASKDDGKAIGRLLWSRGFKIANLSWEKVDPGWILAERDGSLIGCIHIYLGNPIGRLEMLVASKELTNTSKSRVCSMLLNQGLEALRRGGAQAAMGMTDYKDKSWRKVLKRRGAMETVAGKMMYYNIGGGA